MSFLRKLNKPVYALLAVAAIAGALRLYRLSTPPERVFDEIYYSKDACLYDGYSIKECDATSPDEKYWIKDKGEVGSWVHPPMGKWMIAIGEKLFGPTAFGWRFSAALFGTLTCVLVAWIALLLFRSVLWAFIAGLLLATESLSFVQSRVALLDVFVAFWVTLGFLFLVLDRRWIFRRGNRPDDLPLEPEGDPGMGFSSIDDPEEESFSAEVPLPEEVPSVTTLPPKVTSPVWRPWRFAMGAAFGAAAATKWSGAFALAGAFLITYMWERTRRKSAGLSKPLLRSIWQESFGIILALVLLPVAVYLLSYTRWWLMNGFHPMKWWDLQVAMERFHSGLNRLKEDGALTHPYESRPWEFFIMARPVNFYFHGEGAEILSIGNPAIFWGSIAAIPYTAVEWWRKRDPRAGFIVLAVLSQYLPWFIKYDRLQFLFYMTPIVPFMVLACVYALKKISDSRGDDTSLSVTATLLVMMSVGLFIFFWPILSGYPLTSHAWNLRMWFPGWR